MSNQLIYFPPVFSSQKQDLVLTNSVFMRDSKQTVEITAKGSIICSLLSENKFQEEMILMPDFTNSNLPILKYAFINTPFNFFQQCGPESMAALYQDGRIRFWDLSTGKCYLVSPLREIKVPTDVTFMESLLISKNRFIIFIS